MNHIYRLVWNDRTQSLIAVAETARGRGKSKTQIVIGIGAVAGALMAISPGVAVAGDVTISSPVTTQVNLGNTVAGNGNLTISPTGSVMFGNSTSAGNILLDSSVTGSLTNQGTIAGPLGAPIGTVGIFFTAGSLSGSLVNEGTISAVNAAVKVEGSVISGLITNSGKIESGGYWAIHVGGNSTVSGRIENSGTIGGSAASIAIDQAAIIFGGITNTGLLDSIRSISVSNGAKIGSAQVNANVLNNNSMGDVYVDNGTIYGSIVNDVPGMVRRVTITNTGYVSRGVTNSGALERALIRGSTVQDGFTNAGQIQTSSSRAFAMMQSAMIIGDLVNTGEIVANGATSEANGIQIKSSTVQGHITNSGTVIGHANTDGYGIYFDNSTITGGIINNGYLRGESPSANGQAIRVKDSMLTQALTNQSDGTLSGLNEGVYGENSQIAGVTNSGVIESTNNGRGFSFGQGVTIVGGILNEETGTIVGQRSGIRLYQASITPGGIVNRGVVEGSSAVNMSQSTLVGGIVNTGTLSGNGWAGIGIKSQSNVDSINNSGVLVVSSTSSTASAAALYAHASAVVGSVSNSGLISANMNGLSLANTATGFAIHNTGTISAPSNNIGINTLNLIGLSARVIGNTTATTGDVTVNGTFTTEGTFAVDQFTVANGGTLNPAHAITATGGAIVASGGRLNVGSATGQIAGNYTQAGTLALSASALNIHGTIAATGTASVAGTLAVDIDSGLCSSLQAGESIVGVITAGSPPTLGAVSVDDNCNRAVFTAQVSGNQVDLVTQSILVPTSLAINAGNGQTGTAGSPVSTNPSVIIKDQNNQPIQGVTVTFAVASGGGSVSGGTATTDANGIATVGSWTLGTTAGSNTLTASSGSLQPVTFTATGEAAAANSLVIQGGNGQTAIAGSAVTIPPSVLVTDENSNPKAGVTVTFAVASGGGSVSGGTATTDENGIATVGSWTLGTTAGSNSLTASSGSLQPVTFTATGASALLPSIFAVSPSTGPQAGGTPIIITGANLTGASQVLFDGTPATDVSVNPAGNQISATSPAHAGGAVDITVVTPAGQDVLEMSFTYDAPPVAPGTPIPAPGDRQVNVSWPQVLTGGDPASYTVTALIGGTPSGQTCTIPFPGQAYPYASCVVTGLTNGTAYTFRVTATNALGTATSGPSVPATPNAVLNGACGAANGVATLVPPAGLLCGTGTASAVSNANGTFTWDCTGTNGGSTAQCSAPGAASQGSQTGSTAFTSDTQTSGCNLNSARLITPPDGGPGGNTTMPYGVVNFELVSCSGNEARVRMTYAGIVEGMQFWKYLVNSYHPAGGWFQMPANQVTLSGNTAEFTIVDNGEWDNDPTVGAIADPGGPGYDPNALVAPGQPTNVTATPGNQSATVSWQAPTSGGQPVRYVVAALINGVPTGQTCEAAWPATTCTVQGLTNGQAYTFTVTAENGAGQSAAAVDPDPVTPRPNPVPPPNPIPALGPVGLVGLGSLLAGVAGWRQRRSKKTDDSRA